MFTVEDLNSSRDGRIGIRLQNLGYTLGHERKSFRLVYCDESELGMVDVRRK